MNISTFVLFVAPLLAIPAAIFIAQKQAWTPLAVSLVCGCLGMVILFGLNLLLGASQTFWQVWAYGLWRRDRFSLCLVDFVFAQKTFNTIVL